MPQDQQLTINQKSLILAIHEQNDEKFSSIFSLLDKNELLFYIRPSDFPVSNFKGCPPNELIADWFYSSLEFAILRGTLAMVKLLCTPQLIRYSTSLNTPTLLHIACQFSSVEVIEYLLKNGAPSLISQRYDELSPLDYAITKRETADREEVIQLLLTHNAFLYLSESGKTGSFALACGQQNKNIAKIMIDDRKDSFRLNDFKCLIRAAEEKQNYEVLYYILIKGGYVALAAILDFNNKLILNAIIHSATYLVNQAITEIEQESDTKRKIEKIAATKKLLTYFKPVNNNLKIQYLYNKLDDYWPDETVSNLTENVAVIDALNALVKNTSQTINQKNNQKLLDTISAHPVQNKLIYSILLNNESIFNDILASCSPENLNDKYTPDEVINILKEFPLDSSVYSHHLFPFYPIKWITLLSFACMYGTDEMVASLLKKGAYQQPPGELLSIAPIHIACYHGFGSAKKVEILLNDSAAAIINLFASHVEFTPLMLAINSTLPDKEKIVNLLIEKGADIFTSRGDILNINAFEFACCSGDLTIVKMLLSKAKSSDNFSEEDFKTLVQSALKYGTPEIIHLLLMEDGYPYLAQLTDISVKIGTSALTQIVINVALTLAKNELAIVTQRNTPVDIKINKLKNALEILNLKSMINIEHYLVINNLKEKTANALVFTNLQKYFEEGQYQEAVNYFNLESNLRTLPLKLYQTLLNKLMLNFDQLLPSFNNDPVELIKSIINLFLNERSTVLDDLVQETVAIALQKLESNAFENQEEKLEANPEINFADKTRFHYINLKKLKVILEQIIEQKNKNLASLYSTTSAQPSQRAQEIKGLSRPLVPAIEYLKYLKDHLDYREAAEKALELDVIYEALGNPTQIVIIDHLLADLPRLDSLKGGHPVRQRLTAVANSQLIGLKEHIEFIKIQRTALNLNEKFNKFALLNPLNIELFKAFCENHSNQLLLEAIFKNNISDKNAFYSFLIYQPLDIVEIIFEITNPQKNLSTEQFKQFIIEPLHAALSNMKIDNTNIESVLFKKIPYILIHGGYDLFIDLLKSAPYLFNTGYLYSQSAVKMRRKLYTGVGDAAIALAEHEVEKLKDTSILEEKKQHLQHAIAILNKFPTTQEPSCSLPSAHQFEYIMMLKGIECDELMSEQNYKKAFLLLKTQLDRWTEGKLDHYAIKMAKVLVENFDTVIKQFDCAKHFLVAVLYCLNHAREANYIEINECAKKAFSSCKQLDSTLQLPEITFFVDIRSLSKLLDSFKKPHLTQLSFFLNERKYFLLDILRVPEIQQALSLTQYEVAYILNVEDALNALDISQPIEPYIIALETKSFIEFNTYNNLEDRLKKWNSFYYDTFSNSSNTLEKKLAIINDELPYISGISFYFFEYFYQQQNSFELFNNLFSLTKSFTKQSKVVTANETFSTLFSISKNTFPTGKDTLEQETAFARMHRLFLSKKEDAYYQYALKRFAHFLRNLKSGNINDAKAILLTKLNKDRDANNEKSALQYFGPGLHQKTDNPFIETLRILANTNNIILERRLKEYEGYLTQQTLNVKASEREKSFIIKLIDERDKDKELNPFYKIHQELVVQHSKQKSNKEIDTFVYIITAINESVTSQGTLTALAASLKTNTLFADSPLKIKMKRLLEKDITSLKNLLAQYLGYLSTHKTNQQNSDDKNKQPFITNNKENELSFNQFLYSKLVGAKVFSGAEVNYSTSQDTSRPNFQLTNSFYDDEL